MNYYGALDIGGTKTAVSLWAVEDDTQTLLGKEQFSTRESLRGFDIAPPEEVLDRALALLGGLCSRSGSPIPGIPGLSSIGISCGGPLDSVEGRILSPPNLPGWDDVPILSLLGRKTGLPCFLENDANACALAEWYWGAGRGCQNMVFLTFGTGLGAGLILNGALYRGTNDLAGEVGHLRIAPDGPLGYGKRGSWEGFCSGGGISGAYRERTGRNLSAQAICQAAAGGDEEAAELIRVSARYLGLGIASLIDLLNPERIVIGSIFVRSEKLFRSEMERCIREEALEGAWRRCQVLPAALGELLGDSAALGVAVNGLKTSKKSKKITNNNK